MFDVSLFLHNDVRTDKRDRTVNLCDIQLQLYD